MSSRIKSHIVTVADLGFNSPSEIVCIELSKLNTLIEQSDMTL